MNSTELRTKAEEFKAAKRGAPTTLERWIGRLDTHGLSEPQAMYLRERYRAKGGEAFFHISEDEYVAIGASLES
jgi:hypothetical protein